MNEPLLRPRLTEIAGLVSDLGPLLGDGLYLHFGTRRVKCITVAVQVSDVPCLLVTFETCNAPYAVRLLTYDEITPRTFTCSKGAVLPAWFVGW